MTGKQKVCAALIVCLLLCCNSIANCSVPDEDPSQFGTIELFDSKPSYCLDTMGRGEGGQIALVRCHGQAGNQQFHLNGLFSISQNELCLTAKSGLAEQSPILMTKCDKRNGFQKFETTNNQIRLQKTDYCVEKKGSIDHITLGDCDHTDSQHWKLRMTKLF